MIYYIKRYRNIAAIMILVLIIITGVVYKNTVYETEVVIVDEKGEVDVSQEAHETESDDNKEITVYVCGNVLNPSNVSLPKDSRVADAIKLAGGATELADLNGLNLAQKLIDEDMVYVPQKGEVVQSEGEKQSTGAVPKKNGKININKATIGELDTLPGIGPATAQKIIDYREESGGFKSTEEINNVSGIGVEKYKDMKNMITVD